MSEEAKAYTDVLLPGARVALFTRDSETRDSFLSLQQDWRFARVELQTHEGDVDTAINAYESQPSPDLVIVQTETINEGFSGRLEVLGGACGDHTSAIVIGPVNDVNLYRKLVGMGVSDYLVRPVKAATMGNDIAASLIEKIGETGSRLIALIGAKGGVGTTSLAEALSWGLADHMQQKTFLLDAAGGWSTLNVGLNFEPTTTINEAVRAVTEQNEDSLTRMLFSPGERLTVLSSGGDVMLEDLVQPDGFEALLDRMMSKYPVVVVDLSGGSAALKRTTLVRAHEILLITTPTLPSIRATRTLIHEIKQLRGGHDDAIDVILNMVGLAPKSEVPKKQIEEGLERKAAASVPFDPGLFIRIESEARKLGEDKSGSDIVEKLLPLARKVLAGTGSESSSAMSEDKGDNKKGGGIGNLFSKLKARS